MTGLSQSAQASAHVARAIALLEGPSVSALDQTTGELLAAITDIAQIRDAIRQGEITPPAASELKPAIAIVRRDLERARLLLRRAWEFRARCSGQAGYTSQGELSARPDLSARWAFQA